MGRGSDHGISDDDASTNTNGFGNKIRNMLRRSTKEAKHVLAVDYDKFELIMNKYWDYQLRANPGYASFVGIHDYDDQLPSYGETKNEADIMNCEETLRTLDKLFPDNANSLQGWSKDQKTTFFHFKTMIMQNLIMAKDRFFLMPVNNKFSFHTSITQLIARMRFRNEGDFEVYQRRLAQVPRVLDEIVSVLRIGLREGMLPAKVSVENVPDQIAALVESARKLDGPFRRVLQKFDEVCKSTSAGNLKDSIEHTIITCVIEPFLEYSKIVKEEYIPHLPEDVGLSTRLANGSLMYTHLCQHHTTTNITPGEIHEIGLKEVERIRAEMVKVANQEGFNGETAIDDYAEYLDNAEEYIPKSVNHLLTAYRAKCMEVLPELPRLFGKLPRATFGVRAIPDFIAESAAGAYYEPPSRDGSQPGWFNANCSHLKMRKLYTVEALGHHMQIALQMEHTDHPPVRKFTYSTAYVEGWGLYCESLGKELGFYKQPSSWYGRLSTEMLRACRLVVDTGMHHHGWSKERAMEYMRFNKAGTEQEIDAETTRYITNPGQALAYKIGEIKLHELRTYATDVLGDGFDVRKFHDTVLAVGGVSLSALEQVVKEWVEEERVQNEY